MTNGEKIQQMIPSVDVIEITDKLVRYVRVEQRDEHNRKSSTWIADVNIDWWNAEYKESTMEHVQKIDKSAMMHEIYMAGVNMAGEYQGCWVRFKEIEKIIDKYVR